MNAYRGPNSIAISAVSSVNLAANLTPAEIYCVHIGVGQTCAHGHSALGSDDPGVRRRAYRAIVFFERNLAESLRIHFAGRRK